MEGMFNMSTYIAKRGKRVGKLMMGAIYIHKSAISTLSIDEKTLYNNKLQYIGDFSFDIVKINLKESSVSFIQSPDWDVNPEPSVGDSIIVKSNNSIKITKGSNLIYHHKWMFVSDNYTGFDVAESKQRSELWMNHPKILTLKSDKYEKFNSKIGRREYWNNMVCSVIDN